MWIFWGALCSDHHGSLWTRVTHSQEEGCLAKQTCHGVHQAIPSYVRHRHVASLVSSIERLTFISKVDGKSVFPEWVSFSALFLYKCCGPLSIWVLISVLLNRSWGSGEPQRREWCQPLSQGKEGFSWVLPFLHSSLFFSECSPHPWLVGWLVGFPIKIFFLLWDHYLVTSLPHQGLPLGTQMIKNPPAVQEMWVQSLG